MDEEWDKGFANSTVKNLAINAQCAVLFVQYVFLPTEQAET